MNNPLINEDQDILSGTPVFYGTRVPIQNLIDYLSEGSTIDEFLDDFPSVSHEQVLRFLKMAQEQVIAYFHEDAH